VAMNISVRAVEGHPRMVFSRMNVSSAAQLVRTVLRAREADSRPWKSPTAIVPFTVAVRARYGCLGSKLSTHREAAVLKSAH